MIFANSHMLTTIGLFTTAVGTFVGAWALIQARRTENKAATREEVQQAFEMQGEMLDRYKLDNDNLRGRNEDLHRRITDLVTQLAELKVASKKCERDVNALAEKLRVANEHLSIAEARIVELGGEL